MPTLQDSIAQNTVIAYPKKEAIIHETTYSPTSERIRMEAKPLHTPTYDGVLLSATLLSALLLFSMLIYIKKHRSKVSFLSNYFSFKQPANGQIQLQPLSIFQHLLSFTTLIAIGYYLLKRSAMTTNWRILLYTGIGVLLFVLIRILLILITSYFTQKKEVANGHFSIIRLLNKLLGLLFVPLLVVALLLPEKSQLLIILFSTVLFLSKVITQLIFVYKLLRARKFSIFHSFLYLCALEVLPLIYAAMLAGFLINEQLNIETL